MGRRLEMPCRLAWIGALALVSMGTLLPFPANAQVVAVAEVRVEQRVTHDPIPSATITISETGISAETDDRGRATIRGVPPGVHALHVSALGYGPATVEMEAVNGRTARITVILTPTPIALPGLRVNAPSPGLPPGVTALSTSELGPTVVDLPAALEQVPGVTVVQRGGPGAPASIQLRGSSSDQVLVLLDGSPLNSPLTGEVDLNTVDLASLQNIVVLPGAQSARYGPRALGGVVLLESRSHERSTANLSFGTGAWGFKEASGGGAWLPHPGWTVQGTGHWSQAEGDFLYDVPDFRGGGVGRRENADYRRAGGSLRITREWARVSSSLRLHQSDIHRGSPGTIAQPSLTGVQNHRRHGGGLSIDAGNDEVGASLLVDLQKQRAQYRDSLPPFGQAYDQTASVSQRDISVTGWKGFGASMLRLGADLRGMEIRSNSLTTPTTSLEEVGVWSRAEVRRSLGERAEAGVQLGLRLDHHDLIEHSTLSPSLLATLDRGETQLQLAFRSAFAPPGLEDLFFQEGVLAKANPELKPERVKGEVSVTLGQQLRLLGSLVELRLSAYQADIDDMIIWSPDFQFVWSPGNFNVSRNGLEVGSSVEFPAFGRTHSLSGQASWSHVEYQGGILTGQVAYRPVFSADFQGRVELPVGDATLSANHIGSRRSAAGSGLNTLPAYTILDLGFGLPISLSRMESRWEVVFSNLLDERAALLVDYPLPGRGWSTRIKLSPPNRS